MEIAIIVLLVVLVVILGMLIFFLFSMQRQNEALREQVNKQLAAAKTAHDKTVIERQITATDQQINQLVYELYGLTEKEIKIVEGSSVA